ncbi:hypothetical protein AMTR_s00045p00227260 [Amborella trichopoda]|uniref:F-box domain-containing protein n=2 Tax=Amborella trichopoda TaxID=13333 RepID=W1P2W3_AMBTC|nr:hypothetical protein AMTR_s00045p00227260 [Amborella trichopoda]
MFSHLSEDIILNIFLKLEDDPRHWACLACVCTRFSTIIRTICWKHKCLTTIPAIVYDLLQRNPLSLSTMADEPPGGWSALQKVAVCCPGLLHAGVLFESSDFGLERAIGPHEEFALISLPTKEKVFSPQRPKITGIQDPKNPSLQKPHFSLQNPQLPSLHEPKNPSLQKPQLSLQNAENPSLKEPQFATLHDPKNPPLQNPLFSLQDPKNPSLSTGEGPSNTQNSAIVSLNSDCSWSLFDDLYSDTVYDVSEIQKDGVSREIDVGMGGAIRPSLDQERENVITNECKRRKKCHFVNSHLASGVWNLSREQGNKLLASRFRGDCLYICDWPGCLHAEEKRNYRVFRGVFKNFKRSRVWRNIKDTKASKTSLNCAFCSCKGTWDLLSSFCLRTLFEYHDDGEPAVRAYVCENGHVSGAWTDWPMYT